MKVKERFSQLFTTGPQQAEMKRSRARQSNFRTYEVGVGKLSKARDYALRCNGNLQITIRWLSVFVYQRGRSRGCKGCKCTPTFPGEKFIYLQEFSCLVSKSPQNRSQSTKFCKIFWGGMPPDPPSRARSYGTCTDASPPGFFAPPHFLLPSYPSVYCRWSYTTASVDIARRIATSHKVVGQNPTSRIGMQLFKYHREATQQREWLPVPSEI